MSFNDWDTNPANNTSKPGIDWSEGQLPSTVNGSARGMMADLAAWRDYLLGGTSPFAMAASQAFAGNVTVGGTFGVTGLASFASTARFRSGANGYIDIKPSTTSASSVLEFYDNNGSRRGYIYSPVSGRMEFGDDNNLGYDFPNGNVRVGVAEYGADGNIAGSAWGGLLSSFLAGKVGGTFTSNANGIALQVTIGATVLLLQAGDFGAMGGNGSTGVTFPVAHTTTAPRVFPSKYIGGPINDGVSPLGAPSTTGFTVQNGGTPTSGGNWFSIGVK